MRDKHGYLLTEWCCNVKLYDSRAPGCLEPCFHAKARVHWPSRLTGNVKWIIESYILILLQQRTYTRRCCLTTHPRKRNIFYLFPYCLQLFFSIKDMRHETDTLHIKCNDLTHVTLSLYLSVSLSISLSIYLLSISISLLTLGRKMHNNPTDVVS